MDHYLDRNQSCGCLEKKNCDRFIDDIIDSMSDSDQQGLPAEMELGKKSFGYLAMHFGLYGRIAPYVMARLWKRWSESIWSRFGERRMLNITRVFRQKGERLTATIFGLLTAEVRVMRRWYRDQWLANGHPPVTAAA